jgi:hypothetical protein
MNNKSIALNFTCWFFGILVLAIGIVNSFWGNDPFFGIFLLLLSTIYFPPVNVLLKKWLGFSIPVIVKIVLGIFILWAALGVGELFDKMHMMMMDIKGI